MTDAPTEPAATTPPTEPTAPVPPKRGRKPDLQVPDNRPLKDRVDEAYARLRANDRTIYAALKQIEASEQARRDANNRAAAARASIRARDHWLQQEAIRVIQKETGIYTIPGFAKPPNKAFDKMRATQARLKAAEEKAKQQLHTELPHAP